SDRIARSAARQARQLQPQYAKFTDGAEETLKALAARGYRIAVVTNLDTNTAAALRQRLRLDRFIREEDVFTAEGRLKKPHRRLFRAVAAKLGTRCVMVGDSYRRDIRGAVHAGWNAIWIRKPPRRGKRRAVTAHPRIAVCEGMKGVPE